MSTQSKEQQQIGFLSLCYHYIRPDNDDPFSRLMGTKITEFKNQIKMLKEKFEMISLDDVLEFINTKIFENNKHKMLLTFDDGLSEHYNAAKILKQFDIKATFFIPTCILKERLPANPMIIHYVIAKYGIEKFLEEFRYALKKLGLEIKKYDITYVREDDDVWKKIAEIKYNFKYKLGYKISREILLHIYQNSLLIEYPNILEIIHLNKEQIHEMLEMGHRIGVHTHTHISVAATSLSDSDFFNEIVFPKKYLEDEFNVPIKSFSYPFGERKDYLSSMRFLNKTKEYDLAFTVEEIVNFGNTPLEIGRYQPMSHDNVRTLENNLSNIIKKNIL
jgi:peptidoglycan/xylan/chitin deacetylase (PgdA/CDA1 family)